MESLDAAPTPATPESLGWLWVTSVNYLDQHGGQPIAEEPHAEGQPSDIRIDDYIKGARTVMFEDADLLRQAGFDERTTVSVTHNPEQVAHPGVPDAFERKQQDVHSSLLFSQEPAKLLVNIAHSEEGDEGPLLRERLITISSEAIQDGVDVLDPKVIERLLAPSASTGLAEDVTWEELVDNLGAEPESEVVSQNEVDKLIMLLQLSHEKEINPEQNS